jgi:VCBS repeat-containing protein
VFRLNVNAVPTAANLALTINEDTFATGLMPPATDADGHAVTYARVTAAAHGSSRVLEDFNGSVAEWRYSYSPGPNFNGTDSFTYSVNDGHGGTTIHTITITVNPVNDAPRSSDRVTSISVEEDVTHEGSLPSSTDVEGDAISYTLDTVPQHGTASIEAGGSFEYAPDADFAGSDSFTYLITDVHGASTLCTVNVTVTPQPDTHVAGPGPDALTGGPGIDTFVFGDDTGQDTVASFQPGVDVIDLSDVTSPDWADFSEVAANLSQVGSDARLDLGDGDSITLLGVNVASLTAAEFNL